ncbi:hypothetical protein BDN70DRAFT_939801 [Pholiota conissans]|uniref:Uncharacterized protein n=1 Tax=Pholiota conissans TaxID=109636 RepID=A0A9P6CQM0_9AGAR|nr:hypothetical protein BDN70DRAFT_939801 [Pholiota conissans]
MVHSPKSKNNKGKKCQRGSNSPSAESEPKHSRYNSESGDEKMQVDEESDDELAMPSKSKLMDQEEEDKEKTPRKKNKVKKPKAIKKANSGKPVPKPRKTTAQKEAEVKKAAEEETHMTPCKKLSLVSPLLLLSDTSLLL